MVAAKSANSGLLGIPRWRQILSWTAKLAVTVTLFWVIISHSNMASMMERFREATPGILISAIAVIVTGHVLGAIRWKGVMSAIDVRLRFLPALRISFIGLFFNSALPSVIGGDAIRAWELTRLKIPLVKATGSVLLDRVAALMAIVMIVVIGQPVYLQLLGNDPLSPFVMLTPIVFALGIAFLFVCDRFPIIKPQSKLFRGLVAISSDARHLFFSLRSAGPVIFYSLVIQLLIGLSIFLLAWGFQINFELTSSLIFMPLVLLVSMIPVSIAGWGMREAAMVVAFSYDGIASSDALLVSVTFGVILTITSLPGGILWLMSRRATVSTEHPSDVSAISKQVS